MSQADPFNVRPTVSKQRFIIFGVNIQSTLPSRLQILPVWGLALALASSDHLKRALTRPLGVCDVLFGSVVVVSDDPCEL